MKSEDIKTLARVALAILKPELEKPDDIEFDDIKVSNVHRLGNVLNVQLDVPVKYISINVALTELE